MTKERQRQHKVVEQWLDTELNQRHFTKEECLKGLENLVRWGAMTPVEYKIAKYELTH